MVRSKIAVVSLPAVTFDVVHAVIALHKISVKVAATLKDEGFEETDQGGIDLSFSRASRNRDRKSLSLSAPVDLGPTDESDESELCCRSAACSMANLTIGLIRTDLNLCMSGFLAQSESTQVI